MSKLRLDKSATGDAKKRRGIVYVLMNPYMPDLIKIGLTSRSSDERTAEISRATGVPADFRVVYDAAVSDCRRVEKAMHERFADNRVNERREFFKVAPKIAIDALSELARRFPVDGEQKPQVAEVLPQLEARMRRWIKRSVVAINIIQYSDLCMLEILEQPNPRIADMVSRRVDMGHICDDENPDLPMFDAERNTLAENVHRLVDLDVYSMLMVGFDFVTDEAADYIAELVEKFDMHPPHGPMGAPTANSATRK